MDNPKVKVLLGYIGARLIPSPLSTETLNQKWLRVFLFYGLNRFHPMKNVIFPQIRASVTHNTRNLTRSKPSKEVQGGKFVEASHYISLMGSGNTCLWTPLKRLIHRIASIRSLFRELSDFVLI